MRIRPLSTPLPPTNKSKRPSSTECPEKESSVDFLANCCHLLHSAFTRCSLDTHSATVHIRANQGRVMYEIKTCLMPVTSQAFLSPFSRPSHAFAKVLARYWQARGACLDLGTPWVVLGYTLGSAWVHRTCTLGKRGLNRWWKNKFPYMAFSLYLCKFIRAGVWEQSEYNLGDGRETNK